MVGEREGRARHAAEKRAEAHSTSVTVTSTLMLSWAGV